MVRRETINNSVNQWFHNNDDDYGDNVANLKNVIDKIMEVIDQLGRRNSEMFFKLYIWEMNKNGT